MVSAVKVLSGYNPEKKTFVEGNALKCGDIKCINKKIIFFFFEL